MSATLHRFLCAGVLLVWGGVLVIFCFSGKVGSYLHPSFHVWTEVSGIVLVLMAIGMVVLPGGATGVHSLSGVALRTLVLVVPLLLAALVSDHQFGVALVANRGLTTHIADLPGYTPYAEPPLPGEENAPSETQAAEDFLPRTEDGAIKAQSVDLLYAAQEPSMRKDFEDQEVELIGQFMPARSNNAAGDRFNLVRMFVMCCASDARPVAVTIQTQKPESLPEMSWIKVKGRATFPVEAGRRVPVVLASSVTPTEPPPESFIY
jgi:putative membrane protein